MFIGKEGFDGTPAASNPDTKKTTATWMLVLSPRINNPINNASGMTCTLLHSSSIARVVQEEESVIRHKILQLGHCGEPAVLKTGEQDELMTIGNILSKIVCSCYFNIHIVPMRLC